jgi:predicted permease
LPRVWSATSPATNQNIDAVVMTFSERLYSGPIRLVVLTAMGAVGFVLLIACANVASLLLVRSAQRAREIAIRVSIGATRARIVRHTAGREPPAGRARRNSGLLVAKLGTHWFDVATQGLGRPYYLQFTMDGHVLTFFVSVCLAAALIFGLAPALHSSKIEIAEIMKEGGRAGAGGLRARRWTGALVIAELALALVLLAGAGFMIRSFLALYRLDSGVDTAQVLTASLVVPDHKYPTAERRADFYRRLDQRLIALGPIRGATLASHLPLGGGATALLAIDGRGTDAVLLPTVTRVSVGPTYFNTLGIEIERGRAFVDADGPSGHEVAIVNQRLAATYFAGVDPLGQRIKLLSEPSAVSKAHGFTIVGISPTVRQRHLREFDPDPVIYVPYRFAPTVPITLMVRATGEPSHLTGTIREAVRALDPDLPLFGVATLDQALAQSRSFYRIFGLMFAAFGVVALILSALGLYAVTAYTVTQRTHEIGVRVALGAGARQVWWLIARRSVRTTGDWIGPRHGRRRRCRPAAAQRARTNECR